MSTAPNKNRKPVQLRGHDITTVDDGILEALRDADGRALTPALRAFGKWLGEGKRPPIDAQLEKLQDLTGEAWTFPQLIELRKIGAFSEYVDIMREKGIRAARERMSEIALKSVNNLDWAMDRAKAADDYVAMPKITSQVIERVMPRRDDLNQQNIQVNVLLSPKQLALEEGASIEVTAEPIAPDAD